VPKEDNVNPEMSPEIPEVNSLETEGADVLRRKPYTKPEIIHELALETRAGSPLGVPDPFDPFGLDAEE